MTWKRTFLGRIVLIDSRNRRGWNMRQPKPRKKQSTGIVVGIVEDAPAPLGKFVRRVKSSDPPVLRKRKSVKLGGPATTPSPASYVLSTPPVQPLGKRANKKKTKQDLGAAKQRELRTLQSMSIEELQSRVAKYGTNSLAGQVLAATLAARQRHNRGTRQSSPPVNALGLSKRKKKHAIPSKTGRVAGYPEHSNDPLKPWSDTYEMPEYDFE
jgi:hypothetical protein